MSNLRTTQTSAELPAEHDAAIRTTQTSADVVAVKDGVQMRATQVYAEAPGEHVAALSVTQLYVDVVAEVRKGFPFPTGPILVGMVPARGRYRPLRTTAAAEARSKGQNT